MYLQQTLCEECSRIVLHPPAEEEIIVRRYSSIEELSILVDAGCAFCLLVFTAHNSWDHGGHEELKGIEIVYGRNPRCGTEAQMDWNCRRANSWSSNPVGEVFTYPNDPAARYISYRPLEQSPNTPKCRALMHKWLQDCYLSHTNCSKRDHVVLPTRLIDIGLGQDPQNLRLYIPPTGSKGKYAALSYCWGTSRNLILTSDNLTDMLECIPVESLPHTFDDAVSIARELNIPYLWIDALCIIQDSREDWHNESAKMSSVYNNAFLTIQATGADDATKGCFLPRTSAHPCDGYLVPNRPILAPQPPVMLPFLDDNGSKGMVYVRFGLTPDEKIQAPAQMRGWIYQESLLSPRLMSFGVYKLYWECATAYHDESGSSCVNYGSFPGLPKPFRQLTNAMLDPRDYLSSEQKLWTQITIHYCRLRLTYPRDKLPALAGVARQISHTRPGDKYCAGMWKNDMPATLMWEIALQHDQSGRRVGGPLREYRAPSWSWAAWDGLLEMYSLETSDTDGVCEVVDISMTLVSHDPFGEVSAGELQIRGLLRQGWRFHNGKTQFSQILLNVDPLPDDDAIRDVSKGTIIQDFEDPNEPKKAPYIAWFFRVQPQGGLLLEYLQNDTYRRIGLFRITKENWFCTGDLQTITII